MQRKKSQRLPRNRSLGDNPDEQQELTGIEFEAEHRKMSTEHVANVDNKCLEPLAAGCFVIGSIDEINGADATEVPEFKPTRHELIHLVKYWKKRALDSEYWVFLSGQIGSTDIRMPPFAYRRISRIAALIGEDEIRKVVHEVETEFSKSQNPKAWNIFLHGTSQEREQIQEEFHRGFPKTQ